MSKAKVTFPSAPDTSAIDVQDEGSSVVLNPTTMNFVGSGVVVTENPTGTAEIDIAGLQYWTESEDSAVQQSTIFTPNNSATDVNAVLLPKGTGANIAQKPDNSSIGGGSRGQYATDWQKNRTSATQVASGDYSFIGAGRRNTASGDSSAVIGGFSNRATNSYSHAAGQEAISSGIAAMAFGRILTASGTYAAAFNATNVASGIASFAGGSGNLAENVCSVVFGRVANSYIVGSFTNGYQDGNSPIFEQGAVQYTDLTMHTEAELTTGATTDLFIDGNSSPLIPKGTDRAWNVVGSWVAVVDSIIGTATGVNVGDIITQCNLFAFKKVGGTSSKVGSTTNVATHSDSSMSTAAMAYAAGGVSQNLIPTFTAPTFVGGGSLVIRVTLKLALTEIAF